MRQRLNVKKAARPARRGGGQLSLGWLEHLEPKVGICGLHRSGKPGCMVMDITRKKFVCPGWPVLSCINNVCTLREEFLPKVR